MATPRLVSVRDFNTSTYSQLADTSTANISDILARAERAIESQLNRPIAPTTMTERYRPESNILYLRYRPVISVASVTRKVSALSTIGTSVTGYIVNEREGTIEFELGGVLGYIVDVTYTAGFTETPEDIKQAIIMKAALFASPDFELFGTGDAKEPGIRYMLKDIESLLRPYQQLHVAFTR